MIIVRSPLRITLGGGGTDMPDYYSQYGGFLISAAIDKYTYVSISKPFKSGIYLKYSELESVHSIEDVKHPIIREALKLEGISTDIEISSFSDIPAGTGLGSSGSFTTALLRGLRAFQRRLITPEELAELACHLEIDMLGEPIGKQDQYIAAFGGITVFNFNNNGSVDINSLSLAEESFIELQDSLLLFFTGYTRSASSVLKDQSEKTRINDSAMIDNLHYVKELGRRSYDALIAGHVSEFGSIMHEHWEHKKKRSLGMSNSRIDQIYTLALSNGAIGGKVVGAGGGGFLMFLANDKNKLRAVMKAHGFDEVRFKFEPEGTKIIYC